MRVLIERTDKGILSSFNFEGGSTILEAMNVVAELEFIKFLLLEDVKRWKEEESKITRAKNDKP